MSVAKNLKVRAGLLSGLILVAILGIWYVATASAGGAVAGAGLTPEQILKRELDTGVPVVYRLGADSRPVSVEVLG